MDVRAVSDNRFQAQLLSVTNNATVKTAQTLHEKTPAAADTLDALDRVIGAMESGRSLEMYYDKDIGRIVVQVVDGQTDSVICQIPPEGIVNSMKSFRNYLKAIREGV